MNSPLKAARLRRGETLQKVADAIGTDTGNLSRIERGQTPNTPLTKKILAYFAGEVSEVQLLQPREGAS